jgi:hypothetical protein
MIPVFERAKTIHALDRAAPVVDRRFNRETKSKRVGETNVTYEEALNA